MFFRQRKNRILLLHSYRDGEGKVCQRRLATFLSSAELQGLLSDGDRWADALQQAHPDIRCNAEHLRELAAAWLEKNGHPQPDDTSAPSRDDPESELPLQSIKELIAQEACPEKLAHWAKELDELSAECRRKAAYRPPTLAEIENALARGELDAARVLLEELLPFSRNQRRTVQETTLLRCLELLGEVWKRLGQPEKALPLLEERVRCRPDPDAIAAYGACLHTLGQHELALKQYRRLPKSEARRFFHLAATLWELEQHAECVEHLAQGLLRDRTVGDWMSALQCGEVHRAGPYWQQWSELWSPGARDFFATAFRQFHLRWTVRMAQEAKRKPRRAMSPGATRAVLEKTLPAKAPPAGRKRPRRAPFSESA